MIEKPARHDVLFVLKTPPPYGGGEIEHLYIYEELRDRYSFLVFSRRRHSKASQGKIKIINLIFGLGMMLKIARFCLKHKPKIVFLWLPKDYPAFLRTMMIVGFFKLLRIEVVGDLHGMGFSFLSGGKRKAFFEKQINKFDVIRTLSLSISNDLRACGFNNIIVPVDNGVRAPKFIVDSHPQITSPLQLLYLGAISDSKGFIRTLHLIVALVKQNIECHLTVVGEWTNEEFRRHADDFISQNELSPLITFAGILNGEAKWRALENSHFLLHFSEWDGQPLTIIEAMAAGVPTLAHAVGGIPEMIMSGENGFLVESSRKAAETIIEVLGGRIDYQSLSQAAKSTFQRRFTIQRYIENIEKLVVVNENVASDAISKNW